MAHKKGQGSSRNGRDSNSQRLGVKRFEGNLVTGGSILVRQRGRKYRPGLNVGLGPPAEIRALAEGYYAGDSKIESIRLFPAEREPFELRRGQ